MFSRFAVGFAAIAGGACWCSRFVLDDQKVWSATGNVGTALFAAGLVWLVLALAGMGMRLANRAGLLLKGVLAIATPTMGYVLLSLGYSFADRMFIEAVLGGVVALGGLLALGSGGRTKTAPLPKTPVRRLGESPTRRRGSRR
jgi:hypothetical protein